MKYKGKYCKRRAFLPTGSLLIAVCFLLAISSALTAKYLSQRSHDNAAEALVFYFESDYLAAAGSSNEVYVLKEGVYDISFDIRNHPDSLRYAETNIQYTVSLTKDGQRVDSKSGSLAGGKQSADEIQFTVAEAGTYVVTAQATGPYVKTLQASFVVKPASNTFSYSVSDNAGSPFLKVDITSQNYTGNVVISYPAGVMPDNTDPLLTGAASGSCTVALKAHGSYTFLFFKSNPSASYADSITVEKATP